MSVTQVYKISYETALAALAALYVRRHHVTGYIKDLEAGAPANEGETADGYRVDLDKINAAIRELEGR